MRLFLPFPHIVYIFSLNIRFAFITFHLKQNKIVFHIDNRKYFTYDVGKFLDISVLNRRAENCPNYSDCPYMH